jgi:tRNA(fMet)-specific endonuclease VapC
LNYLLDTNACIAAMQSRQTAVQTRLEREASSGSGLHVPSMVLFELWYGAVKSAHREANMRRIALLLDAVPSVLPLEHNDARAAGEIRASFERAGRPIGSYDILIAGQALARDLILVTSNQREFARIKGLRWEDWAEAN